MDPCIAAEIVDYIENKKFPKLYTKNSKRRLREHAESFIVTKGTLYHKGKGEKNQKVVIGKNESINIIQSLHDDVIGGCHFGQDATIRKVSERFWWRGMAEDIRDYCKSCSHCQRMNPNNKPLAAELHPVKVTDIFERWGVDLIGPLNETQSGKRFVIVATEYLTKWVEVAALPDKSALSVHEFLINLVFRYGACHFLLHDQGREFCNALVKNLCDIMSIKQSTSSAYHPQSNGLTERFNQTLITQLMKLVNTEKNNWDDFLQPIAFAYRTNRQASVLYTPFQLMFGVPAKLPCDLQESNETADIPETSTASNARMEYITETVCKIRKTACSNIQCAQAKQKERYDIKHSGARFNVGDKVLKCNTRKVTRMGDRLEPRFIGPYVIHEVLGKGVYKLTDLSGKVLNSKVNVCNLRLWYQTDDEMVKISDSQTKPMDNLDFADQAINMQHDPMWIPSLHLKESDKRLLETGDCLNDRIIDAVNKLVAIHMNNSFNFQTTLLRQTVDGFRAVDANTVQILHDTNHWITVASTDNGVVFADSMRGSISDNVKRQMKQLFENKCDDQGNLHVTLLPCQRQHNSKDCGVYAAANSFELALGALDLQREIFVTSEMRAHLCRCLSEMTVISFPKERKAKRGRKERGTLITF